MRFEAGYGVAKLAREGAEIEVGKVRTISMLTVTAPKKL